MSSTMMAKTIALVMMAACSADEGLSTAERALLDDGLDTIETDGTVVDQVEVTLSGDVDPALTPDDAAVAGATAAAARLTPSTCIESTVQGNVATHVLAGCTGPRGRVLSGTIVSTWSRDGLCLRVEHATTNFTINRASATGSLGVTICRSGTIETRSRDLAFSAVTRSGKPISLTGGWELSLDTTKACATQSGTVTGTIGDRTIDRMDDGFAWCASQAKRAPLEESESIAGITGGVMILGVQVGNTSTDSGIPQLRVEFLGGGKARITDLEGNILVDNFTLSDDLVNEA